MTEAVWPYSTLDEVSHLAIDDVDVLRARIDQLIEERALAATPPEPMKIFPAEWKLTPQEARLLQVLILARPGTIVSRDDLWEAVALNEQTNAGIVTVVACKARKKLQPHGVDILTHWGQGLSLDPGSRALIEGL